MANHLDALQASVARLRGLVEPLEDEQLTGPSYNDEWSIADTLSHLGSGAVIMRQGLDATLAGEQTPDPHPVWDEWNAKPPRDQADDALTTDSALEFRLQKVTESEQAGFTFSLGGHPLDFAGFVTLRLGEHALHAWDVEVMGEPGAILPTDAAEALLDYAVLMTGFAGKPIGVDRTISIATTDPGAGFELTLAADGVRLARTGAAPANADLELPAEALIRLVTGRLDPDHTPAVVARGADLDELRRAFPGF